MENKPNSIQPPKWPGQLLAWYCDPLAAEDLVGDVEELFYCDLQRMSPRKASSKYTWRTLGLIFSYAIKRRKQHHRERYGTVSWMSGLLLVNSYLKVGMRSLVRHRFFTLVNVIGMSIGMCVGLLALAAWVDMTEVDDFHTHKDRIYRVVTHYDDGDAKRTYASSSAPLHEQVEATLPGVELVLPLRKGLNTEVVQPQGMEVPITGYYTTPAFFEIFDFPLFSGNASTALEKPFSVVLTQSYAAKLFFEQDPVGKILEVKDLGRFEVTAVVRDHERSHLLFEALVSYSTLAAMEKQDGYRPSLRDWGPITDYYTYLLLAGGKDPSEIEKGLEKVAYSKFQKQTGKVEYGLQALGDIPKSDHYNEPGMAWGYLAISLFFMLALLILLPACFNYANISISLALRRGKEIGLRKVVGGQKRHIFMQFLMETVIVTAVSLFGAIGFFMFIRGEFLSLLVEGSKTFDLEITGDTMLAFVVFALLTGIIAGLFPALHFARLNPINTLRNASSAGKHPGTGTRKGLVVAQFALSLVFIMGVFIIIKQYHYALNYDMGFQQENILDIPLQGVNEDVFRAEFSKLASVKSISMSSSIPGSWESSSTWVRSNEGEDSLQVNQMFVDHNYIDNLELTLLAGTTFPVQSTSAERHLIVNEQFLRDFDLPSPREAIGRTYLVEDKLLTIVGVVKDFNHMPLREKIGSFFFRCQPWRYSLANLKLSSTNIRQTLKELDNTWQAIAPGQKFRAQFLDDELEKGLAPLISVIKIFGFLGLLAISISCLGLLAMVVFVTESRNKEMGIRKVMGASVAQITFLLSGGFVKLIGWAVVIAVPVTYLFFDKVFLRIHHYRAVIGPMEILVSILLLLVLGMLTIGSRTIVIARENPVNSLKDE